MKISQSETSLLQLLDSHDQLVCSCANGDLEFGDFIQSYNDFYDYYAFDGHESDEDERLLFHKYEKRILPHRIIKEEILLRLTSDEHAENEDYKKMGWIGTTGARKKLNEIVLRYLNST